MIDDALSRVNLMDLIGLQSLTEKLLEEHLVLSDAYQGLRGSLLRFGGNEGDLSRLGLFFRNRLQRRLAVANLQVVGSDPPSLLVDLLFELL